MPSFLEVLVNKSDKSVTAHHGSSAIQAQDSNIKPGCMTGAIRESCSHLFGARKTVEGREMGGESEWNE